jgi:hypothetical protein
MKLNWLRLNLELRKQGYFKEVYEATDEPLFIKKMPVSARGSVFGKSVSEIKKQLNMYKFSLQCLHECIPDHIPKTDIVLASDESGYPYIWTIQEKIRGGSDMMSKETEKQYREMRRKCPFLDIEGQGNFIWDEKQKKLYYVDD